MEYTNIKLDKENAVATIRLNRPDALNALSPDLLDELSDAVSAVAEDQAIKAMVVRGEGRAFCAGADLTFLIPPSETPTSSAVTSSVSTPACFSWRSFPSR